MAEITKRRLRGLHQNTQIGLAPAAAATTAGASASSHPQPEISILLSLAPLDPSQPGYQPPLTDEEILNACVDDEPEQDCGDGATSGDAAASAAAFAPPPTGASSGASSGGAGPSAAHAAPEDAVAGSGIGTAAATAAADAAAGDDARSVVFLDIDGVLLPFGEGAPACAADGDPARSFPRQCLAALARLLEARSPPQPAP